MSKPAARFEGVWKAYPRWLPGKRSLRAMASRRIRTAVRRGGEAHWALRDVSFELQEGEAIGLVGRNGAGKSTLLRLASGLGRRTRGEILTTPNIASVLSLGSSIDEELTGRENALTSILLSGMPKSQALERVDAALEFAELEDFSESPVRSYSEGMKLRLAFGAIAQLEPDLLMLDEVIAVGDLRFREKCLRQIEVRRERGMSLIFASHDLEQIESECDRAVWLDRGDVRGLGRSVEVVEAYRQSAQAETFSRTPGPGAGDGDSGLVLQENRFGSQEMTIESVRVDSELGPGIVESGHSLTVEFALHRDGEPIREPVASVSVYRVGSEMPACEASTDIDEVRLEEVSGVRKLSFRWDDVELLPGEYLVDVGVYETDWQFAYDYHWHVYPLKVLGAGSPEAIFRPRRRRWSVDSG
ncbi:MAG TPA: ATP-binding cassette domain-containing protein [Solirubrobacterales bacterium]|jgi:lipopolysaccharide transport system ATP-binding protein